MAVAVKSTMFVLSPLNTALVLVASAICYFLVVLFQKRRMMNGLVRFPVFSEQHGLQLCSSNP